MNYNCLIESVKEKFREKECISGILVFGSILRKDFNPNFSDVDLLMVLKYHFIIPQDCYKALSISIREIEEDHNTKLDVSLFDKKLPSTKFNTFGPLSREYSLKNGEIICGEDIRNLFSNYFIDEDLMKSEARGTIGWNLYRVRKKALQLEYYRNYDEKMFEEILKDGVASLMNFLRHVLYLQRNEWLNEKEAVQKASKLEFGNLPVINVSEIGKNWKSLSEREKVDLFYQSINLREQIIATLVERKKY